MHTELARVRATIRAGVRTCPSSVNASAVAWSKSSFTVKHRVCGFAKLDTTHTRTFPSLPAVAAYFPLGDSATDVTASL